MFTPVHQGPAPQGGIRRSGDGVYWPDCAGYRDVQK